MSSVQGVPVHGGRGHAGIIIQLRTGGWVASVRHHRTGVFVLRGVFADDLQATDAVHEAYRRVSQSPGRPRLALAELAAMGIDVDMDVQTLQARTTRDGADGS